MGNIAINIDSRHAATLEEHIMSKPSAIFQFGPSTTRYEIRSTKCPHCQKVEAWNPCATGLNFPRQTGKPSIKVTVEVCHE